MSIDATPARRADANGVSADVSAARSTAAPTDEPAPTAGPAYVAVNPEYPRSWWMIAFSCDVKKNQAVPLKVLERDLVLWRDGDGVVHAQAGHCPHLGAHFGYGGSVVNNTLRCGFHGWQFDGAGTVVSQPGNAQPRKNACLPSYRLVEKHGALFLWNGAGEPDIDFPDFLSFLSQIDATPDDVTFHHHRWFLPFPAKWFGENLCDGMHFAIAHDTGAWGDTIIHDETPTTMEMENAIYERRPWLGAENIARRFVRREVINLLTPVSDNVMSSCWGGSIHLVRFAGRPRILGTIIACWLPVDADTHYVMDITLVPKVNVPVVGKPIEKLTGFVAGLGNWSTAIQDAGLMMHRREPENPPYTKEDRGLIRFRRLWDSRIESHYQLEGDNIRSNGLRAGIRVRGRDNAPNTERHETPDVMEEDA